jgi:putative transposase
VCDCKYHVVFIPKYRKEEHMLISIPPKYAAAQLIGYIKGKSTIHVARRFFDRKRNFVGQHFWARGYLVSPVGRDERAIREYIRSRGEGRASKDKRQDQPTGTAPANREPEDRTCARRSQGGHAIYGLLLSW